ncbi:MAG TPA: AEC family transporter [Geobacteraceae bacterium]|nr:AEC family transporter [Geobacteraceae bacterium]
MDKVFLITGIFTLALVLRRVGVVREKYLTFLVRYVITFSLPCLTLMTIGTLDLEKAHFDIALIAWLVMFAGAAISWVVGKMIRLEGSRLRVFILVATFPNTALLGYPLSYALFGEIGLSYAVIYDQMGMFPVFLTLGFFVAGGSESLFHCLKFPPFLALLAALVLNVSGIRFSGPFAMLVNGIGWTTLPLTIFIIGARVKPAALRDAKPVVACLALRMFLIPLLLTAVLFLLGMCELPYRVTLLQTAMPPALTTSIIALQYRLDEEFAIACISAGSVLCVFFFTISMLFF